MSVRLQLPILLLALTLTTGVVGDGTARVRSGHDQARAAFRHPAAIQSLAASRQVCVHRLAPWRHRIKCVVEDRYSREADRADLGTVAVPDDMAGPSFSYPFSARFAGAPRLRC